MFASGSILRKGKNCNGRDYEDQCCLWSSKTCMVLTDVKQWTPRNVSFYRLNYADKQVLHNEIHLLWFLKHCYGDQTRIMIGGTWLSSPWWWRQQGPLKRW
jgi:hypothetical protein